MKISLQKEQTSKDLAVGFSWTLFFFSFIRQIYVGSYKTAALLLLLFVTLPAFLGQALGFSLFFALNWGFCFFINRCHLIQHLQEGYLPVGSIDREMLLAEGLDDYLSGVMDHD